MAANNLGTAYIKIAPQMQGIQGSITRGLQSAVKSSAPAAAALGTVISKGVSMAMDAVSNSIDRAITRVDTLNAFPKIMKNLGFSTEESTSAISKLSDRIEGLPTGLDEIVNYTQRLASTMGNLNSGMYSATNLAIAFNDAALAGGKGQLEANRAFEQFSQVLSRGRPSMQDWKIMMEVMPGQLKQMAKYMGENNDSLKKYAKQAGKTVDQLDGMDLYEWISEDKNEHAKERLADLTKSLIDLDNKGGAGIVSFKDQVGDATHTIGNALSLIPLRISKAVAEIIQEFGSDDIYKAIDGFTSSFKGVARWIIDYLVPPIKNYVIPALKAVFEGIGNVFKMIGENEVASRILAGFIYALLSFKAVKAVVPTIKAISGVVGTLASKLNIFKVTSTVGNGVGRMIADVLKPLGNNEVVKGAASAAIIAGGIWVFTDAISRVSTAYIDWGKIALMEANMAIITAIMSAIGKLAGFSGAIAGISSAVIGGGLWVFAKAMADVSNSVGSIDWVSIYALQGHLAILSGILSAISLLGVFSSIGSIVSAVIGGGVMVAAKGLFEASKYTKKLKNEDLNELEKMLQKIASWNTGDIFQNLSNMISSGLLSSVADSVHNVVNKLTGLKPLDNKTIDSLVKNIETLGKMDTGGDWFKSLSQMWTSGHMNGVAENVKKVTETLAGVEPLDDELLKGLIKNIVSLADFSVEGDIFGSLSRMWSSDNIKNIANNVKETTEILSQIKYLPDDDRIQRIKDVIKKLSEIEIKGSGLFENRGGAAEELEKIVGHVLNIGNKVNEAPWIDYDKVARLVDAIKLFDRIDNAAKDGINRLNEARDGIMDIGVITGILLKVPDNLPSRAQLIVDALTKFKGFNAEAISATAAANAVGKLLAAIITALQNGEAKMVDKGKALASKIRDGIASNLDQFNQVAQNVQGAFWGGLEGKMQDEYNQGKALSNNVKNGISSVINDGSFKQTGIYAGQGVINGLQTTFTTAYAAGRNLAAKLIQGVKDRGKEGSPWKTTFQSGIFAGQGLANGLLEAKDDVVDAANIVADATQEALGLDTRSFGVGLANTNLMPNEALTSGMNGLGGQVTQYNNFTVNDNLDVNEISKRLGWQVATAL